MKINQQIKKGEHGYISSRKRKQIIKTVLSFVILLAIYFYGYVINDNSRNNVFTTIAILLVLPSVRFLLSALIVLPYKTVEDEKFKQVSQLIQSDMIMLTDLIITSSEKIMNLSFIVLANGYAYILVEHKNMDLHYIETYINRCLKNNGDVYKVKVFSDYQVFVNKIKSIAPNEKSIKVKESTVSFLLTLNV